MEEALVGFGPRLRQFMPRDDLDVGQVRDQASRLPAERAHAAERELVPVIRRLLSLKGLRLHQVAGPLVSTMLIYVVIIDGPKRAKPTNFRLRIGVT